MTRELTCEELLIEAELGTQRGSRRRRSPRHFLVSGFPGVSVFFDLFRPKPLQID